MNPGVSIRFRYSDEDVIQLEISAGNGAFSGYCEPYFTQEALEEVSRVLSGFPSSLHDEYTFEFSETQQISYLRLFVKDRRGRVGIECRLHSGFKNYPDSAHFFVFTEIAQVNQAGVDLAKLIEDEETHVCIRQES